MHRVPFQVEQVGRIHNTVLPTGLMMLALVDAYRKPPSFAVSPAPLRQRQPDADGLMHLSPTLHVAPNSVDLAILLNVNADVFSRVCEMASGSR
jgi:hypothetical protein